MWRRLVLILLLRSRHPVLLLLHLIKLPVDPDLPRRVHREARLQTVLIMHSVDGWILVVWWVSWVLECWHLFLDWFSNLWISCSTGIPALHYLWVYPVHLHPFIGLGADTMWILFSPSSLLLRLMDMLVLLIFLHVGRSIPFFSFLQIDT